MGSVDAVSAEEINKMAMEKLGESWLGAIDLRKINEWRKRRFPPAPAKGKQKGDK